MKYGEELYNAISLIDRIEHKDGMLTEAFGWLKKNGLFKGEENSVEFNRGLMSKSMTNGLGKGETEEEKIQWSNAAIAYLGEQENYFGFITNLAREHNTEYPKLIKDLYYKVEKFLTSGYFGKNPDVVSAITSFLHLLEYMHGTYESAMSKIMKKMVPESLIREGMFDWFKNQADNLRYRGENQHGMKQKVRYTDQEGNTVKDYRGQWITDLRNELESMLNFRYLHGPKTVEATKCFIQYLTVDKRGAGAKSAIMKKMRIALIGVAALSGVIASINNCSGNGNTQQPQNYTQQVQQKQNKMQVGFLRNHYNLSNQDIQKLRQLGQQGGEVHAVISETVNPSGKDASYEEQLIAARAKAIQQALGPNCKFTYERGENVEGDYARVVITVSNNGGQQIYTWN